MLPLAALFLLGAGDSPPILAVLPVELLGEARTSLQGAVVEEAVLAGLQDATEERVLGASDLAAAIDFRKREDLKVCDVEECFREIGGALGVARLLAVKVARSDRLWTVTAKVIELKAGAPLVAGRLVEVTTGDADDLIAALPGVMRRLALRAGLARPTATSLTRGPVARVSRHRAHSGFEFTDPEARRASVRHELGRSAVRRACQQLLPEGMDLEGVSEMVDDPARYVLHIDVFSEEDGSTLMTMSGEVELDTELLRADLEKIIHRSWAANRPKTVVATTLDTSSPGAIELPGHFLDSAVVQALAVYGFVFLAEEPLAGAKVKALRQEARAVGATLLIVANGQAQDCGTIMGTHMHSIRGLLSLRAIQVGDGTILADVTASGAVGHIDMPSGGAKALERVAKKAAAQLVNKLNSQR